MHVSLTLTRAHADVLARHLFPTDGCEAVALMLCGRRAGKTRHRLVVQRVVPIPYEQCSVRLPDRVTWSTRMLETLLAEAARRDLAIVKVHGHVGLDRFSDVDDASDRELFPSIHAWTDNGPHASAILMDDGRIFGRAVNAGGQFTPLTHVNVVGDDLVFHRRAASSLIETFATVPNVICWSDGVTIGSSRSSSTLVRSSRP